jgi:hypothetical protein
MRVGWGYAPFDFLALPLPLIFLGFMPSQMWLRIPANILASSCANHPKTHLNVIWLKDNMGATVGG